ncbi:MULTISPECIES: hypothetical protein [Methylocaldum]|uniref:hypothetical protein n=1 Tax=unclassified Methylocaldum TaxID=2622260 RepID=UPI00105B47BD|nr:hypothetical protein [Methylocaldum sp. 14B]MDV3240489.1 hypothetical protein [Methylocaldum sp.]MVF22184.1 hypothetical protein [Methylocaldum sp. BRCS4]
MKLFHKIACLEKTAIVHHPARRGRRPKRALGFLDSAKDGIVRDNGELFFIFSDSYEPVTFDTPQEK